MKHIISHSEFPNSDRNTVHVLIFNLYLSCARATFDPRIVSFHTPQCTVSPLLCWQRFEECREKFEAVVVRRRSRIFTRGLQSWREEEQSADRVEEHSSQEASRKAQQLNLLND